MITIANADKALKSYYLEALSAQLDAISPFYAAVEKNSSLVYGKDVKIAVVRGEGNGVLAGAEDGDLPGAAGNRYLDLTAPLKNIYGTVEVSDKAMRASKDGSGAFVNLVNAEMEGLIESARVSFSRMLYGDGNGYIATVISKGTGTTLNVDSVGRLREGMTVDVRSAFGTMDGGEGLTVTAVDYTAGSVTLSALPDDDDDPIAGKYLYVSGAYGNEITGFKALFGSDDIYGNDRSDSYFVPATFSVTTLTESLIMEKINYLEQFFNRRPNMILCSYSAKAKIAELLSADTLRPATTVLEGGYSAILFDGIPVVADRYCPESELYLINTDDFVLCQLCDWSWLEDEDGKILKQVPGKAAYSATLVKYAELVCKRPCAQGLIRGF